MIFALDISTCYSGIGILESTRILYTKGARMKRILMGVAGLFFTIHAAHGMNLLEQKVSLAKAELLKQRIDSLSLAPTLLPPMFYEESEISHNLAQVTCVGDLISAIFLSIGTYNGHISAIKIMSESDKETVKLFVSTKRRQILQAVLQDQPDLIEKIKKDPVFKAWH